MKLRSIIFIIAFALGMLPLLILVGVNLSGHISRHEQSTRTQAQANSRLRESTVNRMVAVLENDIHQILILPEVSKIFSQPGADDSSHNLDIFKTLLTHWFQKEKTIIWVDFLDSSGVIIAHFQTLASGEYVQARSADHSTVLHQKSEAIIQPENSTEPPLLQIIRPYINSQNQKLGGIRVTVNLLQLLNDYDEPLIADNSGRIIFPPPEMDSQTAPPLLPETKIYHNRPFIEENSPGLWTAWIPLTFNSHDPIAWLGSPIDRRAAEKWKESLIINIISIIFVMVVIIFFIATFLASKIDAIKEDILHGLDRMLTNEEEVRFNWRGPKEVMNMADELTLLAKNYAEVSKERRRMESELKESEDKFRNLTSTAQDAIVMMGQEGKISYWNLAAEELFGYTAAEAYGKAFHTLISPRLAAPDSSNGILRKQGQQGPIRETIELITCKKDGSDVPIELSLSEARIKDEWHSIWIIRDISERKRAAEEAHLHQQQLIQADKMISLGLLVSGVAHEINNPNSISLLNTPMLSRAWKSILPILENYYAENGDFPVAGLDYSEMRDQVPRLFSELEESARRIKTIVQDLKDYARRDTTLPMDTVDINKIAQAAVRLTHNQIKNAAAAFDEQYANDLPLIRGNSQRLEQVLINLIQNSCEALADKKGALTIKTGYAQNHNRVFLKVEDEGCGISPEALRQVTDPFYTTKRTRGGTGLGLSVSAGIIKEHNGAIHFYSELHAGTTVEVSFPAVEMVRQNG